MTQPDLFRDTGERVKSPICSYQKHCGGIAVLGEPEDRGGCINRTIDCETCGKCGVESTRTDI